MAKQGIVVNSPVGNAPLDCSGSAIGAVRVNPELTYFGIPTLLKEVIDQASEKAWADIRSKIDYTYACLSHALDALEGEIAFAKEVKVKVEQGQDLFFKPNIVSPGSIDSITHGAGNIGVCTPWSFVAALMRWFHDRLGISYHQMSVGEAGTSMTATAAVHTRTLAGKGVVTTQALLEGRSGDFYGGWGFYFARKYLADSHDPGHTDDPMNGYEESVAGLCLPPGRAKDKLMVYDLNKIDDDRTNGRDVPVAGGVNYQTITLHKVLVGGDPNDSQDKGNWPGCVLINVSKLKIHNVELLTNAIKNLGIGLYPMEVNISDEPGKVRWKYAVPHKPIPGLKSAIPHTIWVGEVDEDTGLPLRDKDGEYVVRKTGGIQATMADVIQAVKGQDTLMLHVVDAIEAANGVHAGPGLIRVPEGYIFASADPVAVDLLCARYLFTTVPLVEARKIQKERKLSTDFLQRVPIPKSDGRNIVTEEGFDLPIARYFTFRHCEERELGQQDYYVVGRDEWQGGSLASLGGHLGRVEANVFSELLTREMYFAVQKPLWDLQATTLAYIEASDNLTGSAYKQALLDDYDENGDGVIDYDEKGKGLGAGFLAYVVRLQAVDINQFERLRIMFLISVIPLRCINKDWNTYGHDFAQRGQVTSALLTGMRMSQAPTENVDPLFPSMTWGKGKWPSLQFAQRVQLYRRLYGAEFPNRFDIMMVPYGHAFHYADLKWGGGEYTGVGTPSAESDGIGKYHTAIAQGAVPLPFIFYVPPGYGRTGEKNIPNVEETDDPSLIFTTSFNKGREVWRELSLLSIP